MTVVRVNKEAIRARLLGHSNPCAGLTGFDDRIVDCRQQRSEVATGVVVAGLGPQYPRYVQRIVVRVAHRRPHLDDVARLDRGRPVDLRRVDGRSAVPRCFAAPDLGHRVDGGSPRAVGQALKHNPFAPEVPCHRVIGSDLRIGGFGGKTAGEKIRAKIELLASEGVAFSDGKLADPGRVYSF